jgi:hypothetical protein
MLYSEFMQVIRDPNREYNYYFAEDAVPEPLLDDMVIPRLGADLLTLDAVYFWHGIGTVSLPHTDDAENFMCVVTGWKQFTIVSPFQTHLVYAGRSSNKDEPVPENYSPVNFDEYAESEEL